MSSRQCYCTIDELVKDSENAAGLAVDVLTRFILPASKYILGEIGAFLPVAETRKRTGKETDVLFVPPLLSVTSITNDQTSLSASDYQLLGSLESDQPFWPDGPYGVLRIDPLGTNTAPWSCVKNGVAVNGHWGLYERAEATGATLAALQSSGAAAVVVGDGSLLSPGMLLKIESEWQFVKGYGAPTASVTTLSSALDASSEIIAVASGAALKVGELIQAEFEKMLVLDIQGNNAYVERGWMKTKKVAHTSGTALAAFRTFSVDRSVNGSVAVEHASSTAISRMMAPDDVNYLARQIATLMMKKSQTGYAGRSGSSETGESFYTYEFPRDAIARVKNNYFFPNAR